MAAKNPLNSKETRETVIKLIRNGSGLRAACRKVGVPDNTFLGWVAAEPALAEQYARALDCGYDVEADQIIALSQKDYNLVRNKNGALVIDPGEVQARKLEIDTRKWILARRAPKKYGDRVTTEISGPDGGPVQQSVSVQFVSAHKQEQKQ